MKILIVSDTHRRDANLREVISRTAPFDMLIHLGDSEGSETYFREWVNNDLCVIHVIQGNNDFFSFTDREKEFSIGKYRAFLTHGHLYGATLGTEGLKEEARSRGVDIVMFGHTHKPYLEYCKDGLVVLNPGSLSFPRQDGRKPSYMLMELDRAGEAHFTTAYLE
ncbi:MAG: metallophosphoesterase [Lachnospiraceae bacterium]|nr:metallophosphoesterase [Lachnospiraceae bacterium]